MPLNVNGRPNSDVVRPVASAIDLVRRSRGKWTIDFVFMPLDEAAGYETPFEHVQEHVHPVRSKNRRAAYAQKWWQYAEARPGMRTALQGKVRVAVTPEVAKHPIFVWTDPAVLCNQQTLVFARDDDYFLGILHSRLHEVWARAQGTQLRERESGFRYTPTTCFETFPLPWTPGQEPSDDRRYLAISEAAHELNERREIWLNPPEWVKGEVLEFPGSVDGPWARYVQSPGARGIGTVRYPRLVPKDPVCAGKLAKRTLTNLYNERPTWLDLAHKKLDEAVFAAYGWDPAMSDEVLLEKLLGLNLERSAGQSG